MAEYADEFNGFLDRDNLPNDAISSAMMTSGACNEINYARSTTSSTISGEDTGWRKTDGTTNYGSIDFTTKVDSLAFVEWSGSWSWALNYASPSSGAGPKYCVQYKVVINGIEVARIPLSGAYKIYDSGYMCGVLPLPPGNHKVQLFARQWINNDSPSPTLVDAELGYRELIVWARKR